MKTRLLPRLLRTALAAGVVAWTSVASAAIITYTERGSWASHMGSVDFHVDFESFAVDTSFELAPLDAGPFTFATIGTPGADSNRVDVSPFLYPESVPASYGNATVYIYVEGPLAADIVFDNPIRGFFADFSVPGNTEQLVLTLMNGGATDIVVPGTGYTAEPFGFISTGAPIASIRLHNPVNDGFHIDNIWGGEITISEPTPLVLLVLGLAGLGLATKRKPGQRRFLPLRTRPRTRLIAPK